MAHPFDLHPAANRDSITSSPVPNITDDDEEFEDFLSKSPPFNPGRPLSSPTPDNIVRSASPFGRRYKKPINGIQTKGFARSAQRRSSVLTLGSIERLQNFYARKDLKLNKEGLLGFKRDIVFEEPEDLDQLPTPQAPPPSWRDLDVETDLDVLLSQCFDDIQQTLTQWAMVTGPREHSSISSRGSHTSNESNEEGGFQILPLLDSVTKMINSVKNYMHHRHDLSNTASQKVRHAALNLLEAIKSLETRFRKDQEAAEDGEFTYHTSEFGMLEKERKAIHTYLVAVETFAFNPPHHIGSPPAAFSSEIRALMAKTSVEENQHGAEQKDDPHSPQPTMTSSAQQSSSTIAGLPDWLQRGTFQDDAIGRYHALLNANRHNMDGDSSAAQSMDSIPDPHEDREAFLSYLADGITLCNVYNNIVKRSRRPFGFISKIHSDTKRTYRAIENLRYFTAACSFRFELTFKPFDPSEVARKTEKGLEIVSDSYFSSPTLYLYLYLLFQ
ncbi:hypothetical protein BDA99DRAFT_504624 [Phascolomyces articulosus]|uniref:Uncharacterized protein n=1 Tax=Phascolomyces articulosus TaxID=60185 RepID=A0AAD5K3F2_9FUNG|nr:hypothetical protein BDA99DRAFT_504624 [Phascolomyces articulosus]